MGAMHGRVIPKVYSCRIDLANRLLWDKELFLRFPYHPLQTPADNSDDRQTQVRRQIGACWAQAAIGYSRAAADRAHVEAWAGSAGVRERPVDIGAGGAPDRARMRGTVPSRTRMAYCSGPGTELPETDGRDTGSGRRRHSAREKEGGTIIAWDET